eukprot:CAMPEP_0197062320 /NCGR_PEP_ID=MMETSP1384-20130603/143734_1 /TAXON_ID=29189 /ORGANISM="Ammonia sp." /LENGTH=165 /DNA_ID=CAMNT_0042498253 /DNA_START=20 /DNA_END=517 /DNA_ORIENTATION=-
MTAAALLLCVILILINVAIGCQPPNCQNVDCGTCVEACCKLEWNVTGTNASSLAQQIETALKAGGPDGLYSYWGTTPNQGPLTFVVQGKHSTATMHYNDTLNFGVMSGGVDNCTVQAFSHSQDFITGDFAYCDEGQNYKNLVTIIQALGNLKYEQMILFGCPPPK